MARSKFAAQFVYICIAFFASTGRADSQSDLAKMYEKFSAKKNAPLVVKPNSSQEQLILNNRDLKKILKSIPKEGPRTGGGGNSCALVIVKNTEALVKYVEQFNIEGMSLENMQAFKAAIERAKFFTTGVIYHEGERKDAKNYPMEDKIVLSNKFCRYEMNEVSGRAMSLLMHEYLGLAKVDDRKYQISGKFLEKYSDMREQKTEIQYYLQEQANLDMRGEKSCFDGAVLKKGQEMESYSRYHVRQGVEVTVADAEETTYRYVSKYCQEPKNGQRVCDSSNEYSYVAVARYASATSGTLETEVAAFKVNKTVRTVLVVKDSAGYHAEEDEILSEKITTTYTCTPLKF